MDPPDVTGEANFYATAELTHDLGLGAGVFRDDVAATYSNESVLLTAAEDAAESAECVGRKSRTSDRKTKGDRAQHGTNGALVLAFAKESGATAGDWSVVVELCSFGIKQESFDAEAEILVQEILRINAATPGVIRLQVSVADFFRTENEVSGTDMPLISSGESVRAPKAHVQFLIAIETLFRGGRLSHFFA